MAALTTCAPWTQCVPVPLAILDFPTSFSDASVGSFTVTVPPKCTHAVSVTWSGSAGLVTAPEDSPQLVILLLQYYNLASPSTVNVIAEPTGVVLSPTGAYGPLMVSGDVFLGPGTWVVSATTVLVFGPDQLVQVAIGGTLSALGCNAVPCA